METKNYPFSKILGWSNSRYDVFSLCRRQYYYHYYYRYNEEIDQQRLSQLRSLTSIPLQIGETTHSCISTILRRLKRDPDTPIDRTRLSEYVDREIEDGPPDSRFSEVYYEKLESVDRREIAKEVGAAIEALLNSDRFRWIIEIAKTEGEDWLIEPEGYGETRIDGLKAYCKVDFLFPVGKEMHIIDWKTGKERPEKHRIQIRAYAAWAANAYDKTLSDIRPIIAYLLPEYHETTSELNEFDMEQFYHMVRVQTNEMYSFCANIEENIPLQKEAFPPTQVPSICSYCNYRELCNA